MLTVLWRQACGKHDSCHFIGYSFRLAAIDIFMLYSQDRIAHTTVFVTAAVERGWYEMLLSGSVMRDRYKDSSHQGRP